MHILLAPDSYKDSMSSPEVCRVMAKALRRGLPDAQVTAIPMADGGEGSVSAAVAATGGEIFSAHAVDPLGRSIEAGYGVLGDGRTGIVEMASASGLERLSPSERNPLTTTTYGTGQLIAAAMEAGISDIIVAVGGSATVDGGTGMAQALGYNFRDETGRTIVEKCTGDTLSRLTGIDDAKVDRRLKDTRIRVACDVENPLLGKNGAAHIFAPQKGATASDVYSLESGMVNLCNLWQHYGMVSEPAHPGAGAAGGLAAGLRAFCGAELVPGARLMMEITALTKHLSEADLVITGEGRTDAQTASGKLPAQIAQEAKNCNIPIILISGGLERTPATLEAITQAYTAAFSISHEPCSIEQAIEESATDLYYRMLNIARLIHIVPS